MRVVVMGSGGLGGYFGALLARGGTDVSFIARGEHLEMMRRTGVRVEGGADPFHLEHVRATDDPAEIGAVDLVMVCVKLWDTEAALQQLRPLSPARVAERLQKVEEPTSAPLPEPSPRRLRRQRAGRTATGAPLLHVRSVDA
jgi:hypothetical protein